MDCYVDAGPLEAWVHQLQHNTPMCSLAKTIRCLRIDTQNEPNTLQLQEILDWLLTLWLLLSCLYMRDIYLKAVKAESLYIV